MSALRRLRPVIILAAQRQLSGAKQTLRRPYLRAIYGHNGAPDPGAARGKFAFPKLINDPVCYAAAISEGSFPKFFWKNKKDKTRI